MKTLYYSTFSSPLGPFSLAVNDHGDLVATAFGKLPALRKRTEPATLQSNDRRTAPARRQIRRLLAGKQRRFSLPLSPEGTPFQRTVWRALSAIPYGETRTYGQIAKAIGRPSASRAVGRANATNPLCLVVPCHRVIGANGSLTGFAFGEALKRRLLDLEGAAPAHQAR